MYLSTTVAFTVVLSAGGGGWTQAQPRELPGGITCAPTPGEAWDGVVGVVIDAA